MPPVTAKHSLQISFYTRGTVFNGNTIKNKGLGGSESALTYVARELSKRGHRVNVFCSCDTPGDYDGVGYNHADDFTSFCNSQAQDVCVFSRVLETLQAAKAKVKILWLHDIAAIKYYLDNLPTLDRQIDRYFLISAWQKHGFVESFDFDEGKYYLTRNGVDLSLFANPPARDRLKLVYINTPFRGLDVLVKLFPHIRQAVPGVELHMYTGMSLYGDQFSEMEQQLQTLYDQARKMPGVLLQEPLPKAELAQELMSARLALYPSHFPECCSIASLEAQAAGTPMITSALAGLNDTLVNEKTAILIPIDDPELCSHSKQYQVAFLNHAVNLLRDDRAWEILSNNAIKKAADYFSWIDIAAEWEEEFFNAMTESASE